ncbi:cell wall-binding repeat-containing protein [Marinilactibacillus sp. GCM10026970]|uniref:cell wall-binding repeat-containing protein n=1 Tax=Marinilactibacillus sp. GCM10026970 TaxID=3252642 RepID=UPI00361B3867
MKIKLVKYITVAALSFNTISLLSENSSVNAAEQSVVRISGETRYQTATNISQAGFKKSGTVFIANAMNFADALSGGPLAFQKDAPILLANGSSLRPETLNEIKRLGASKAVILGGEAAISKSIENELKKLGLSTQRLAGDTRFETAEVIAEELSKNTDSTEAVVVDGYNFADAMSVGPFAARKGMPIFLTRPAKLPDEARLRKYNKTYIIGGETAVSKSVQNKLNSPTRISGSNRFQTNLEVMNYFGVEKETLSIATGMNFADALTGSVLAAKNNAAVMLVRDNGRDGFDEYLTKNKFKSFSIIGGETAVSKGVQSKLSAFIEELELNREIPENLSNIINNILESSTLDYKVTDNRKYTGSVNFEFDTPYGYSDNVEDNSTIDRFTKELDNRGIRWVFPRDKAGVDELRHSVEVLLEDYTAPLNLEAFEKTVKSMVENDVTYTPAKDFLDGQLRISEGRSSSDSKFLEFKIEGITFTDGNRIYDAVNKILDKNKLFDRYLEMGDETSFGPSTPTIYVHKFRGSRLLPSEKHINNIDRISKNFANDSIFFGGYEIEKYSDYITVVFEEGIANSGETFLSNRLHTYVFSQNDLEFVERRIFGKETYFHVWTKK